MSLGPNRRAVSLACLTLLIVPCISSHLAHAAGFGRAMQQAAEQLGKSSDEVTGAAGRMLRQAADQSDEALEKLAKDLGGGGSWRELADAMKKAGIRDADTLAKQLDGVDEASRKLLTGIFRNGGKAIDAAVKGGGTAADAIGKIVRGGPKAMDALRLVDDPDALRECLEGFGTHADKFPDFVIKGGGENATRFWRRHADEIGKATDDAIDDLLINPTKYLDETGKPTQAFVERFLKSVPTPRLPRLPEGPLKKTWQFVKQTVETTGRVILWVATNPLTALAWLFSGAWLTGTLGKLLAILGVPPALIPAVQALTSLALVGLVINTIAPWLIPLGRWALAGILRLIGGALPGGLGKLLRDQADRVPDWVSPIDVSVPRSNRLTIGVVGTKRVGKTTFIVMLAKQLSNLVTGASLIPDSEADRKKLADISADVSQGRPTRDDKTINLRLSWPFARGRNPGEAGRINQLLVLTDFPGEWAAPDAATESRGKLLSHLRDIDGLMVVIDPTTLEGDSVRTQMDAVDRLFMRDGIDLGRRFKRALAIVITKRDAITPELLSKFRRPSGKAALDEARLFALAGQPELTEEESRELGKQMLELLAPNVFESIRGRLEAEEAGTPSTAGYFPRRFSSPQLAVFAISQLGRSLGSQVVSYRARMAEWETNKRQGPEPTLALDLDGPDPREVEIHYPFRWLFDAIPEGLLHQANAMQGLSAARLRWNVHRRFKGAPVVADDRVVGRKRMAVGLAATAAAFVAIISSLGYVNGWLARREVAALRNSMLSSAVKPSDVRAVIDALMPSQPDASIMATLTRFDRLAEAEATVNREISLPEANTLPQALSAAQELGRLASWRREPTWREEYDLIDASIGRLEKPVLSALVEQTTAAVAPLSGSNAFREAIDLVDKSRSVIPDGVSLALAGETASQLDGKRQSLENAQAQRDLNEAEQQLKTMSGLEAVRCIDAVVVPSSAPPALRDRRTALRNRVVAEFWQLAKTNAETLVSAGKVPAATEVIDGFLSVPSPNLHEPEARDLKAALKPLFVKAAVEQAGGLLQNDKPDEAWQILDSARTYREAADETTRLAWWEMAMGVKLRLRDYAGAVTLLTQPEPGDEAKLKSQMQLVVKEWHDELLEKVDQLVADRKFDQADTLLSQFLNVAARHAESPQREEITRRARMLGQQRLRDELRAIEASLKSDSGTAFARLNDVGGRVIAEADAGIQGDWVRLLIDGGRKADTLAEALRTLDRLLPKDAAERGKLDGWWQEHAETQVKRGSAAISDKRYADGWRAFRDAIDEPSSPESYQTLVIEAASKAWQQRLEAVTTSALGLCRDRGFQEAAAAVNDLRDEVNPIIETSLPVAQDLAVLAKQVSERQLAFDVDQASGTGDEDSPAACRLALDRIEQVLGKPGLADKDRKRVTAAKSRLLEHWEDLAYRNLHKLHSAYDFPALASEVNDYLDPKAEYRESIDAGRRDNVAELQRWFVGFDSPRPYTIEAVSLTGVPAGGLYHWFSDFDPAFRLTATGGSGPASIVEGQRDSIVGAGDIPPRKTSLPLRWEKGKTLRIVLWEEEVDCDGYRYGGIVENSPYALPHLVYLGKTLDTTGGDYKSYDFSKCTIQLRVSNWPSLPKLPQP